MSFWNEQFFFEPHGDRYIYRPTVFSPGITVSESEKEALFRALKQFEWRALGEGSVVVAVDAALFMTGTIAVREPIFWFMVWGVIGIAALGATLLYRRDRLTDRILGHRPPDVPRLGFKQAMTKPRPLIGKRYAVPVLQSVVVLLGLTLVATDGLFAYLVVTAYRSRQVAEGPDAIAAATRFADLTLGNPGFWIAVVLLNAVLIATMAFFRRQVRRLRAHPDFT